MTGRDPTGARVALAPLAPLAPLVPAMLVGAAELLAGLDARLDAGVEAGLDADGADGGGAGAVLVRAAGVVVGSEWRPEPEPAELHAASTDRITSADPARDANLYRRPRAPSLGSIAPR